MYSTKTLVAAAALAVLSAVGMGAASAQPWDARHDRQDIAHDRADLRHDRAELYRDRHDVRRPYAERMRIVDSLRVHNYRVIGAPYFVHGRYVVRTHDRFGRIVFVQVDPYSGSFIREVVL